jgi:nicotinamidase-related amidase
MWTNGPQDAGRLGYDCVLLEDGSATASPDDCLAATLHNVRQWFSFVAHSRAFLPGS